MCYCFVLALNRWSYMTGLRKAIISEEVDGYSSTVGSSNRRWWDHPHWNDCSVHLVVLCSPSSRVSSSQPGCISDVMADTGWSWLHVTKIWYRARSGVCPPMHRRDSNVHSAGVRSLSLFVFTCVTWGTAGHLIPLTSTVMMNDHSSSSSTVLKLTGAFVCGRLDASFAMLSVHSLPSIPQWPGIHWTYHWFSMALAVACVGLLPGPQFSAEHRIFVGWWHFAGKLAVIFSCPNCLHEIQYLTFVISSSSAILG